MSKYAKTIYCENGEDGIIDKIFSLIGAGEYFVEFGAWDGCHLSNTYNLRKNYGWHGLLLDGKFDNPSINLHRHYLTAENITDIFKKYSVPVDFDLLSIDIDGNDIYLLKQILSSYRPRVMVCETNQLISPLSPYAIEYDPSKYFSVTTRYFRASVKAFDDLARNYSYTMVCQHDQNAFFVRNEDCLQLNVEIDNIGSVEHLFKPRIPRWYLDSNGFKVEFPKDVVEKMASKGLAPENCHPMIERTMKNLEEDGAWVLLDF